MNARRCRHSVSFFFPLRRSFRGVALSFCCVLLSACSGFSKPAPERSAYLIPLSFLRPSTEMATEMETMKDAAVRVRLGTCSAAAPFSGSAFVYRVDEARYETDYYHGFAAPPRELLREAVVEYRRERGIYPGEDGAGESGTREDSYKLNLEVIELYGDFRNKEAPAAVLSIYYVLMRQEEKGHNIVFERRVTERRMLPKADVSEVPEVLARTYGEVLGIALQTIFDDLTLEMRRQSAVQQQ